MSPRSRDTGKRKADTPTKPAGEKKFYCNMHERNKTHNTKDCFELKRHTKLTKTDQTYKNLNAFFNTKEKEKEVMLNIFDKFCSLNAESSNEEEKPNKHAPVNVDNDDSSASCLLSDN
eukprot:9646232-Ditylum_brightwellii.AAC.1